MRAVTWTQVAQYVVLLLAFLIPVSWLAYKQLGNPLAPLVVRRSSWHKIDRAGATAARRSGREGGAGRVPAARASATARCWPTSRHGAGARAGGRAGTHPDRSRPRARIPSQIVAAHRELRGLAARRASGARAVVPRDAGEPGPGPAARRAAAARRGLRRRPGRIAAGARGVRPLAPQLPGADVLPDGGHRRPAAPAHALLHDAPACRRRANRWPGRCSSSRCCT